MKTPGRCRSMRKTTLLLLLTFPNTTIISRMINSMTLICSIIAVLLSGTSSLFNNTAFAAQENTPPPAKVALTGATIIPISGPAIPNGIILIEYGKITAVGTDVTIPYDAMEVDLTGKVIMPGMIDPHSSDGLDVPNENLAVAPYLDVYDAIDPSRLFFEDSLRDGITSVHVIPANNCVIGGLSRVLKPIGMTPDDMTYATEVAMKMSTTPKGGFDRMRQLATLRDTFTELDYYLERLAEKKYEESLAKQDKKIDVGPEEARKRGKDLVTDDDYDDKHANLVRLRRGDFAVWIYCGAATDVKPAVDLAVAQGFADKLVCVLGTETYKAVKELKEAGVPVVLSPNLYHQERDLLTGELEETFIPTSIYNAGLMFALQPNPGASLAERYLNYQAAVCVRNGIPRQAALEAITINPAKMLGLDDQLGTIEVGKIANLVVFSGDPLDFNSWVEYSYIDGILAYDRARDHRLTEILKLEAKRAEQDQTEKDKKAGAKNKNNDNKTDNGANDEAGADAGKNPGDSSAETKKNDDVSKDNGEPETGGDDQ